MTTRTVWYCYLVCTKTSASLFIIAFATSVQSKCQHSEKNYTVVLLQKQLISLRYSEMILRTKGSTDHTLRTIVLDQWFLPLCLFLNYGFLWELDKTKPNLPYSDDNDCHVFRDNSIQYFKYKLSILDTLSCITYTGKQYKTYYCTYF